LGGHPLVLSVATETFLPAGAQVHVGMAGVALPAEAAHQPARLGGMAGLAGGLLVRSGEPHLAVVVERLEDQGVFVHLPALLVVALLASGRAPGALVVVAVAVGAPGRCPPEAEVEVADVATHL